MDKKPTCKMFLILFNTPSDLLTLLATVATWSFYFKSSIMMTPNNCAVLTLVISVLSILSLFLSDNLPWPKIM